MEIFQTQEQLLQTTKALEESRSLRKHRGLLAKEFLQSEFLTKFLLPDIETERFSPYPKPDHEGWQAEYGYAHAKNEVYAGFMQKMQAWAKEGEVIEQKETEIPKTIV